tara:strand:+ start:2063 stop:2506 length:444 start_codon:yes stop_codon:yes gene_type:complete
MDPAGSCVKRHPLNVDASKDAPPIYVQREAAMWLLNTKRSTVLTLTKNHVVWSLFALLVWFNYIDTVQTYRLLELKAEELNPFIIFLIGLGKGSFVFVIAYKVLVGIFMASMLVMFLRRSDQTQQRNAQQASQVNTETNPQQYSQAA